MSQLSLPLTAVCVLSPAFTHFAPAVANQRKTGQARSKALQRVASCYTRAQVLERSRSVCFRSRCFSTYVSRHSDAAVQRYSDTVTQPHSHTATQPHSHTAT
eukprot:1185746-Prorocentrum_minimum.AAC.2